MQVHSRSLTKKILSDSKNNPLVLVSCVFMSLWLRINRYITLSVVKPEKNDYTILLNTKFFLVINSYYGFKYNDLFLTFRFCEICQRYSHITNLHCPKCDRCTTKVSFIQGHYPIIL